MLKKMDFESIVWLLQIHLYHLDPLSWSAAVSIFSLNDEKSGIEIIFARGGHNNFFNDWALFVMFYNNIINYQWMNFPSRAVRFIF